MCIIGIAGESASGKTTVSEIIWKRLTNYRAKIFHMDHYYRTESERPVIIGRLDGKEYMDDNHPSAVDLDMFYEDVCKSRSEGWDILILEGIFVLWDDRIRSLLDLKVFVDCDSDERIVRRIKRHMSFGENLEEITDRYIQAVQPRQNEFAAPSKWKADIILNGFQSSSVAIDVIVNWIIQNHESISCSLK